MNEPAGTQKASWIDAIAGRPGVIWWIVFGYILLAGLLIQLVLLPYVFPSWHAGNGLFRAMDGVEFHAIAIDLSHRIKTEGWGAWEPMPEGQFVSGVAAIWYTLIYPAPWSVLPANAALGATAAVFFVLLIDGLLLDRRRSLLASLPFIFFPSSLLWHGQFHNENYAVPGTVLILYGWAALTWRRNEPPGRLDALAIAAIAAGSLLMEWVRDFVLRGMVLLCAVVCLWLVMAVLMDRLRKKKPASLLSGRLVALGAAILVMTMVSLLPSQDNRYRTTGWQAEVPWNPRMWQSSPWMPGFLDAQFRVIARERKSFLNSWAGAGSAIDSKTRFSSAGEVIAYVPRAFQIGVFSPFPGMWFTPGRKITGTAFRAATAVEMSIAYICLLGLPWFVWVQRKKPAIWVILFLAVSMLLVYAITVPNVGSLYRFRYPYFMPLVCLGLAGLIHARTERISHKVFSKRKERTTTPQES